MLIEMDGSRLVKCDICERIVSSDRLKMHSKIHSPGEGFGGKASAGGRSTGIVVSAMREPTSSDMANVHASVCPRPSSDRLKEERADAAAIVARRRGSRRRPVFISDEEFDGRLTDERRCLQVQEWDALVKDIVYRLESCCPGNERVVGMLETGHGDRLQVSLPKSVLRQLMSGGDSGIDIFIRPREGEEEFDMVTVRRLTCEGCLRELSAESRLRQRGSHCG
jgi:hypothetical protein